MNAVENIFPKPSDQGGLPKGQYHLEEIIDGERLRINRPVNLHGKYGREYGYSLTNFSRTRPGRSTPQGLDFTDSMLFEDGLLDLMKSISNI